MISGPVAMFISSMFVMGLAYLAALALRLDRPTTGGLMLVAAFGNTGFLGYPVTMAAFHHHGDAIAGQAMATAVMVDQFSMALPLYSIGVAVAASFTAAKVGKWQVLEFLKTPLFPATVLAIVLRNVHIAEALMTAIQLLGSATIPLAMVSLGLSLSRSSLKTATAPFVAASVLKMVVLPLVVFLVMRMMGTAGIVRNVTVLEASMPTAVMSGVIASRYGANESFVSGATFLMTLLSMASITFVLYLLH
jgi:predicted permease